MNPTDQLGFALQSIRGYPARSSLMLLAMAVGVAAVVVLTALGDGARRYVTGEFASLGTNLLIVIPGRSETSGGSPSTFVGETPRDLTIDDALSLTRNRSIQRVAPLVLGSAPASWDIREREVPIIGTTSEFLEIRQWKVGHGRFLSTENALRATPVCVIGAKVHEELFAGKPAIGEWLRIGDRRFRVVGILESEGRSIGLDVQELVMIPIASAQSLFNTPSLFRIFVEARSRDHIERAKQFIIETIKKRHQGEEDITVITQDAVLATFDKIFKALTLTVAGIAAISLIVAGILIMNVMLVAVAQRTREIGLLKALGASRDQIIYLFITEAGVLSCLGATAGILLGFFGSYLIGLLYPDINMSAPAWATVAAFSVALVTGLVFGVLPARRAAELDPVRALSGR